MINGMTNNEADDEINNEVNSEANNEVNNEANNGIEDEVNNELNNSDSEVQNDNGVLSYNFSLLDVGYIFPTWSNIDSFFEDENISDKFIKNIYVARQILLKSLVAKVGQANVQEIWQITDKRPGNSQRKHFIIIMNSISYMCTCMSNIFRGIICQHYFQVLLVSQIARFHITMIASCWYCNNKKEANDQFNIVFANENTMQAQQNQMPIIPQPLSILSSIAKSNQSIVS
ncbi:10278_t:CDS:2 [Dentiscutata heterogama]|uniref:10278_t:CDS:1 n=1 Tax=Dentiscutata heterogama TaxID=1316150 RepID=A0ACA9KQQ6_9GLOM|nr:10278_t:CDS:2 [Dentiscutata heterogama]